MSISAMKQALEALERADKINGYANNKKAITALRHAIEQAESLDKLVSENQRLGLYDDAPPTCQENRQVAKSATTDDETPPCKTDPRAPHGFDRNASHSADRYVCECEGWEPPKKEWVGLTDDDIAQAMYKTDAIITGPKQFDFAKELEAKLKEKNRG